MKRVVEAVQAKQVNVRGVVQGVGFRPFVYRIARQNDLAGYVFNTSGDVTIVIEGPEDRIRNFLSQLRDESPSQSRIESIEVTEITPTRCEKFEIRQSLSKENDYQLVSPDLATCPDCKADIFDAGDRRFRYPFTNCTNCGPRFTVIEDIPYDRPRTTMKKFRMCPACQKEYDDPADRRFHAQPNACPACGPELQILDPKGDNYVYSSLPSHLPERKVRSDPDDSVTPDDVIARAARLLKCGKILAIKGLGGFLLACDATNDGSVRLLRERKKRPAKPFAVMVTSLEQAKQHCCISEKEAELLSSPAAPIVLLQMKQDFKLSPAIAPGLQQLGVMLPYTPLHHLLMAETGLPLVMTSGNLSEEPIARDNDEALQRLGNLADFFILNNRDIYSRYDDSVVVDHHIPQIVRRARGYAPYPIHLPYSSRNVLACGPELKNTFCLTRKNHAFVSQHIGDMENQETLDHFEETLAIYLRTFRVKPEIIACDMHPDYLPTRWAEDKARTEGLPLVKIQHHHAHIVSCMAENQVQEPVIGVSFDGTGYGMDGKIWGGEFIVADYRGFTRKAHLEYLPLPGGDSAIARPYRIATGYLYSLFGDTGLDTNLPCLKDIPRVERDLIIRQIDRNLNAPLTSSAGRLFDAVSSLLGIRQSVSYEAQAAAELEALADNHFYGGRYSVQIDKSEDIKIIRIKKVFEGIISDLKNGVAVPIISAKFHHTIAGLIGDISCQISSETGIKTVALSGGVFQNQLLSRLVLDELNRRSLRPLCHKQVPCNDGGVSLGQSVVANFLALTV